MKKIIYIVFSVLSFSFLISADIQKIGYVNRTQIISQNEDARLANASVEKEVNRFEAELENKSIYLDSLYRDYQKLELMLTDEMKLDKQREIQDLQVELENLQIQYFSQPNGEIYQIQAEKMQPIINLIQSAIELVAKENSYDYIFDSSQGIVLFALDSFDLTQLVIDKLNTMSIEDQNIEE